MKRTRYPDKTKPNGNGKRSVGRPSKYDESLPDKVFKFCLLLKDPTDVHLAECMDMTVPTFKKHLKENTEFLLAYKHGKDQADADVVRSMYERAKGYSHPDIHYTSGTRKFYDDEGKLVSSETIVIQTPIIKHYAPDPTSGIFWLKNRQRWQDAFRQEHTGAGGGPIQYEQLETEEFSEEELELAARLGFRKGKNGELSHTN